MARKCSKAGGSIIFARKLDAEIALAEIAMRTAKRRKARFRETPTRVFSCSGHFHVTAHQAER